MSVFCKNCEKELVFVESSIDDFWSHKKTGRMRCDGGAVGDGGPEIYAEPESLSD